MTGKIVDRGGANDPTVMVGRGKVVNRAVVNVPTGDSVVDSPFVELKLPVAVSKIPLNVVSLATESTDVVNVGVTV